MIAILSPIDLIAQNYYVKGNSDIISYVPLTFHNYSLTEKAQNGSSFVYDGVDGYEPQLDMGFLTPLNCQTYGQREMMGMMWDYWSASVMWKLKLQRDLHINGTVEMEVYISSTFSELGFFDGGGYGMGLVEFDENGKEITAFTAEGSGGLGNPFNPIPESYMLNMTIDYIFKKSHSIGFFIGAGSTRRGFTFNVHFDSPSTKSGVTLSIQDQPETFRFDVIEAENTYEIKAVSDSFIKNFAFNKSEKQIKFSSFGIPGTAGYCRIWIPKTLLYAEDKWNILVDGISVTPTVNEDTYNTYLFFTYNNNVKTIEIIGTNAIPEFPSLIILLAFLIVTLVIIIYRNRLRKNYAS
jgi:hypothetical protein